VRSGPGAARTILLFHTISARPSTQPRMVGSTFGVYSFGLIFVSARTKKRHHHHQRLAILEFARAMDSSEDWEEKKDAEKRSRYAPVLEFFSSLQEREGWSMIQFNFTVGVRGSISNLDRTTEPLSFTSTLKALGITSRINLDRIRKVVANRIFEAHDLMLRSYYAVKFGSSSQVDFSRLVGTSFALQHCTRLLS
jgi:hypothetical protein